MMYTGACWGGRLGSFLKAGFPAVDVVLFGFCSSLSGRYFNAVI